jgi:hypothetical protein
MGLLRSDSERLNLDYFRFQKRLYHRFRDFGGAGKLLECRVE